MKAAVLNGVRERLRIEEAEVPEVTDHAVLIDVAACGVCSTDLKAIRGVRPIEFPSVLGHELSGTVAAIGPGVRTLDVADRVVVGMRYRCGKCRYCQTGRENLCASPPASPPMHLANGSVAYPMNLGGFSEFVALPEYMVYRIPDGIGLEDASLIGCRVTTAYNAVRNRARVISGESALVIGCGGVGLSAVQFLQHIGADPIIAADLRPDKLKAARSLGATHTIDARRDDVVAATIDLTSGGVDKAFEAIGDPRTADQLVRATAPGGTAVIIGGLPRGPITFTEARFAFREISVTGACMRRKTDVADVISIVSRGEFDLSALISNTYPLTRINDAIDDLAKGRLLMGVTLWSTRGYR